LSVAR
jgi:hypothetical protein